MSGVHHAHFGHTTKSAHRRTERGDSGPPVCPACKRELFVDTDRDGRLLEGCGCGVRYVLVQRPPPSHDPGSRTDDDD